MIHEPRPHETAVSFRLDASMLSAVRAVAIAERRNASQVFRLAVEDFLRRRVTA